METVFQILGAMALYAACALVLGRVLGGRN